MLLFDVVHDVYGPDGTKHRSKILKKLELAK